VNSESDERWTLAPGAERNPIGTALRRVMDLPKGSPPDEVAGLVRRLERRKGG